MGELLEFRLPLRRRALWGARVVVASVFSVTFNLFMFCSLAAFAESILTFRMPVASLGIFEKQNDLEVFSPKEAA